jgi:drug/metabolite transporter (DMT)-like permease
MKNSVNKKAYLAWVAICIIWGTTYLAIRVGVEDLPPMLFAGFRWLIAGPLFLSILLLKKFKLPSQKELLPIGIIGISLLGITNGLVVVAEQWIPSGITALLITTLPFWVVIIELIFTSTNRFNLRIVGGMLLCTFGVTLIFYDDLENMLNSDHLLGMLCILIAMISWAGGSLYSQRKKLSVHPLMSAAIQMIFAGTAQTVLGLSLGELSDFYFTNESFAAFAYLIFVASIFGFGSYIYAIEHLPVSFVTTYAYINPVIALFLGALVLGEKLDIVIAASAIIILIGVWLVQSGTKKSKG